MSKFKRTSVKIMIGGSVVLVSVGVALARLWCPSASEQANAITMEDIEKDAKSFETHKKMAKAVDELTATRLGSAEHEEKLNALIGLFDPDTQVYIKALPREDRINAITMKIDEERSAKEGELARQKWKEKLCWWR